MAEFVPSDDWMYDFSKYIDPDYWLEVQIGAFAVCIFLVLLELFLARKNDTRREETCEHRRSCAAFFMGLGLFCLLCVAPGYLSFNQRMQLLQGTRLRADGPHTTPIDDSYFPRTWPPLMIMHLRSWSLPATAWKESGLYFWWAQQHFAGYLNFVIFLIIQSRIRKIGPLATFAFAWLALTSLGFAQCFFFTYILLTPPVGHRKRFSPRALSVLVLPILAFYGCVCYLPLAVRNGTFTYWLGCCVVIPMTIWLVHAIPLKPTTWRLGFMTVYQAQSRVFFPSAVAGFVVHAISVSSILLNDFTTRIPMRPDLLHALQQSGYDDPQFASLKKIIWSLDDDPSMGTVQRDVFFSFAALVAWAYFTSISLRGIMRCTFWPRVRTYQISFIDLEDQAPSLKIEKTMKAKPANVRLRENSSHYKAKKRDESNEAMKIREVQEEPWEGMAWPETFTLDDTKLHHSTALTIFLGFVGGLGLATAGTLGAGPEELDP